MISDLLIHEVKDPRISGFISVTGVSISKDLSYAKVGISILGDDKEKENIFRGLESARGFLRKELSAHIRLRRIPELYFQEDDSIAKVSKLLELMDNISSPPEGIGG